MDNNLPTAQLDPPLPVNPPVPPILPQKNNFIVIAIIFLLVILFAGGMVFGLSGYLSSQKKPAQIIASLSPTPLLSISPPITPGIILSPTPFSMENWITYTDNANTFQFLYPKTLEIIFSGSGFYASVKSKTDIINEYKKYQEEGGCPGSCGRLASDSTLLQKQFAILSNVEKSPNCTLSPALEKGITDDFILLTNAVGKKIKISASETKNGKCMLKYIESDGFDASLNNFYYKTAIIKDDKVISIHLPLFPKYGFHEVYLLWLGLDYDYYNKSCSANCLGKETKYFESFNLNDKAIKNVIDTYDRILSTFRFVEITAVKSNESTISSSRPGKMKTLMQKAENTTFLSFWVEYPDSWIKEVKYLNSSNSNSNFSFNLSKNNHFISIVQTGMGGAMCLFDKDKDYAGPSEDFRKNAYTDLQTNLGFLRRAEIKDEANNKLRFAFCMDQRSNYGYFTIPLSIGALNYQVPTNFDPSIIREMDEIVKTIQII